MEFDNTDKINFSEKAVKHESAGGFVLYEDPHSHELYVALLKKDTGEWVIPKGHIKKSEEEKTAAIREVREELTLGNELIEEAASLGVDTYLFNLEGDDRPHTKDVHLYVFKVHDKLDIKPLEDEGFVDAQWLPFQQAMDQITFDRENLVRARQAFCSNKEIKKSKN